MQVLVPVFFVALAAIYDLFNGRKIPVWVFLLFGACSIISLFPYDLTEAQKNTVLLGLVLFGMTLGFDDDEQIGRADTISWGATIMAVPFIDYLIFSFLCSCMFFSIWFGLNIVAGMTVKNV